MSWSPSPAQSPRELLNNHAQNNHAQQPVQGGGGQTPPDGRTLPGWDLVEKLKQMAELLGEALSVGERRISDVQSEAAQQLANVQADKEKSQRDAATAWTEVNRSRSRAETAERRVAETEQAMRQLVTQHDTMQNARDDALRSVEDANGQRRQAEERIAELARTVDAVRTELNSVRAALTDAENTSQALQVAAGNAAKEAEDARRQADDASRRASDASRQADDSRRRADQADGERQQALEAAQAAMDQAKVAELARESAAQDKARAESEATLARSRTEQLTRERDGAMAAVRQIAGERDAALEKVKERDAWVDQLAEAVTEQRAQLGALSHERDAARDAAEQARNLIDELTRQLRVIMPSSPLHNHAALSEAGMNGVTLNDRNGFPG
ncbi:hypothetical protein [Actinocorallia longicatena]|uniref:hypothetical protein n=1 Tax=Actinocorallia longicatena TaxID=111803 RepID=UPI0031D855D0